VKLLSELSSSEYQVVTVSYLKHVSSIINKSSTIVQTYGEAFKVLEFLAAAKVLELKPLEDNLGVYKIRKI
jgi:hypothetical protein